MSSHSSPYAGLEHCVSHLAHYLPAQGPIGVFIHHNTLHAFQHLPFEEAVIQAADLFGAEPYLSEAAYREAFDSGRIRQADLTAVLEGEGRDVELRLRMLQPGIRKFHAATIRWEIAENGLREHFREDLPAVARQSLAGESAAALFDFWLTRTETVHGIQNAAVRPREGVQELRGVDLDDVVHPWLIRMCAAFLDQGMAYWPMPKREEGLWRSALVLLKQGGRLDPKGMTDLHRWAQAWTGKSAVEAVATALEVLGVEEEQQEEFLQAELLALPGWAGLMSELEKNPSLAPHDAVPASLMDFLALRLLLTVSALSTELGDVRTWKVGLNRTPDPEGQRLVAAATMFDAAQLMGLGATEASQWTAAKLEAFRGSVEAFAERERRRIWHLAYERRHERRILLPLQQHASSAMGEETKRVSAQIFFCIDDREESIRRHLEEVDAEIETFGAAGFFGVAMNYAGIDDARGVSLCPIVVTPQHAVTERPADGEEALHRKRQWLRRAWARVAREAFVSSRTLVRGWLGTSLLGALSIFPLAARVLAPRQYAKWMQWLNEMVLPEPRTELAFMRQDDEGHQAAEGLLAGFSIEEKADRVASVLGAAGLRRGMARLVVVLGHGSTSLNNPHESAYDCGACGGRRGGPNARIFAAMANHPAVRAALRQREIRIDDDTWFIGGYHDTCSDNIDLYDLEALPASHAKDLRRLQATLDEARARSAQERTRRFGTGPRSKTPQEGLRHVEERAEHLAEPRPEYGHSTNAVCIVGRRSTTRGLFLDRRAFLVSYDATQDPANESLARILGAVIPVCAGINLEYYFSTVDNERYGCGTKLPHNVTGLVGVMNGYEGDLRTGLTWQMVEIHEPVRILFVLETTAERALATIRANAQLREFLDNRWIRLAVMDPVDGSQILAYRGGDQWEEISGMDERLAEAPSSAAWFTGRQSHLPIARIQARGSESRDWELVEQ